MITQTRIKGVVILVVQQNPDMGYLMYNHVQKLHSHQVLYRSSVVVCTCNSSEHLRKIHISWTGAHYITKCPYCYFRGVGSTIQVFLL